jgi:mannosyltransferase
MDSTDVPEPSVSAPGSQADSPGLLHWTLLSLLLLAALATRFWCVTCKPFWFDETYSVELARIDWRNFMHLLWWREANMSLYYLLLRGWLHLGQSPYFIRTLSVLISAATLPAIYWLARRLYDRRVAVIAAALFAFNAYSVRYAQEARSYALFLLLATLSSAFLVNWFRKPSRENGFGYSLASVLAVYAHFYALLLIAAHWLAFHRNSRLRHDSIRFVELRRIWITTGVAILPLLIFVAKTGAGPIKWIHRPGVHDLIDFFEHLAGGKSLLLLVIYGIGCYAAIAPFARKIFARNDWEAWRCRFLLIWLLFPIALTVLLSLARPVFLPRYLIFTLPPLIILTAAGLARLHHAWLLGAALILVLILNGRGILYVYGHDFDTERDESGIAANFVLDHSERGDGIILHIAATRVAYEFFRSLRAGENTASPDYAGHLGPEILFPDHGLGMDYRDFTGKPSEDLVRSIGAMHPRIWLMLMNNGPAGKPDPTTYMLIDELRRSFSHETVKQFARVEVRLYSKTD